MVRSEGGNINEKQRGSKTQPWGTPTSRGQAKDKEAAREKRKNYQGCRRNLQMYLPDLGKKVYQGRWADWLSRMVLGGARRMRMRIALMFSKMESLVIEQLLVKLMKRSWQSAGVG